MIKCFKKIIIKNSKRINKFDCLLIQIHFIHYNVDSAYDIYYELHIN